jgi:hypothetical protein
MMAHPTRYAGVNFRSRLEAKWAAFFDLNQRDVLIVKADRQEPLVVVRPSLAAEIAKMAV